MSSWSASAREGSTSDDDELVMSDAFAAMMRSRVPEDRLPTSFSDMAAPAPRTVLPVGGAVAHANATGSAAAAAPTSMRPLSPRQMDEMVIPATMDLARNDDFHACPLCFELFHRNVIAEHAAWCNGVPESAVLSKPRRTHAHTHTHDDEDTLRRGRGDSQEGASAGAAAAPPPPAGPPHLQLPLVGDHVVRLDGARCSREQVLGAPVMLVTAVERVSYDVVRVEMRSCGYTVQDVLNALRSGGDTHMTAAADVSGVCWPPAVRSAVAMLCTTTEMQPVPAITRGGSSDDVVTLSPAALWHPTSVWERTAPTSLFVTCPPRDGHDGTWPCTSGQVIGTNTSRSFEWRRACSHVALHAPRHRLFHTGALVHRHVPSQPDSDWIFAPVKHNLDDRAFPTSTAKLVVPTLYMGAPFSAADRFLLPLWIPNLELPPPFPRPTWSLLGVRVVRARFPQGSRGALSGVVIRVAVDSETIAGGSPFNGRTVRPAHHVALVTVPYHGRSDTAVYWHPSRGCDGSFEDRAEAGNESCSVHPQRKWPPPPVATMQCTCHRVWTIADSGPLSSLRVECISVSRLRSRTPALVVDIDESADAIAAARIPLRDVRRQVHDRLRAGRHDAAAVRLLGAPLQQCDNGDLSRHAESEADVQPFVTDYVNQQMGLRSRTLDRQRSQLPPQPHVRASSVPAGQATAASQSAPSSASAYTMPVSGQVRDVVSALAPAPFADVHEVVTEAGVSRKTPPPGRAISALNPFSPRLSGYGSEVFTAGSATCATCGVRHLCAHEVAQSERAADVPVPNLLRRVWVSLSSCRPRENACPLGHGVIAGEAPACTCAGVELELLHVSSATLSDTPAMFDVVQCAAANGFHDILPAMARNWDIQRGLWGRRRADGLSAMDVALTGSTNDHYRFVRYVASMANVADTLFTGPKPAEDSSPTRSSLHLAVIGGNPFSLLWVRRRTFALATGPDGLGMTPLALACALDNVFAIVSLIGDDRLHRAGRPLPPTQRILARASTGTALFARAVKNSSAIAQEFDAFRAQLLQLDAGWRMAASKRGVDPLRGRVIDGDFVVGPQAPFVTHTAAQARVSLLAIAAASLAPSACLYLLAHGADAAARVADACVVPAYAQSFTELQLWKGDSAAHVVMRAVAQRCTALPRGDFHACTRGLIILSILQQYDERALVHRNDDGDSALAIATKHPMLARLALAALSVEWPVCGPSSAALPLSATALDVYRAYRGITVSSPTGSRSRSWRALLSPATWSCMSSSALAPSTSAWHPSSAIESWSPEARTAVVELCCRLLSLAAALNSRGQLANSEQESVTSVAAALLRVLVAERADTTLLQHIDRHVAVSVPQPRHDVFEYDVADDDAGIASHEDVDAERTLEPLLAASAAALPGAAAAEGAPSRSDAARRDDMVTVAPQPPWDERVLQCFRRTLAALDTVLTWRCVRCHRIVSEVHATRDSSRISCTCGLVHGVGEQRRATTKYMAAYIAGVQRAAALDDSAPMPSHGVLTPVVEAAEADLLDGWQSYVSWVRLPVRDVTAPASADPAAGTAVVPFDETQWQEQLRTKWLEAALQVRDDGGVHALYLSVMTLRSIEVSRKIAAVALHSALQRMGLLHDAAREPDWRAAARVATLLRLQHGDADAVAEAIMPIGSTAAAAGSTTHDATSFCPACMEDVPVETMYAMDCAHAFCATCWSAHLHAALATHGRAALFTTRCLAAPECACLVTEREWCSKLHKQSVLSSLQQWLTEDHAENVLHAAPCSNSNCRFWLHALAPAASAASPHAAVQHLADWARGTWALPTWDAETGLQRMAHAINVMLTSCGGQRATDVWCACGTWQCLRCGREAHGPATCEDMGYMQSKTTSDAEAASEAALRRLGKPCPKCGIIIVKAGGCKHMTCQNPSCSYQFCYHCGAVWTGYNHQCTLFASPTAATQSTPATTAAAATPTRDVPDARAAARARARLAPITQRVTNIGTLEDAIISRLKCFITPAASRILLSVAPLPEEPRPQRVEPPQHLRIAGARERGRIRFEELDIHPRVNNQASLVLDRLSRPFRGTVAALLKLRETDPARYQRITQGTSAATASDFTHGVRSLAVPYDAWESIALREPDLMQPPPETAPSEEQSGANWRELVQFSALSGICTMSLFESQRHAGGVQPSFTCLTCADRLHENQLRGCVDCRRAPEPTQPRRRRPTLEPADSEQAVEARWKRERQVAAYMCIGCVLSCHAGHNVVFVGIRSMVCVCPQGLNTRLMHSRCATHRSREDSPNSAMYGAVHASRSARYGSSVNVDAVWLAVHGCVGCLPAIVTHGGAIVAGDRPSYHRTTDALSQMMARFAQLREQDARERMLLWLRPRCIAAPVPAPKAIALPTAPDAERRYLVQVQYVSCLLLAQSLLRFVRMAHCLLAVRHGVYVSHASSTAATPPVSASKVQLLAFQVHSLEEAAVRLASSLDAPRLPLFHHLETAERVMRDIFEHALAACRMRQSLDACFA